MKKILLSIFCFSVSMIAFSQVATVTVTNSEKVQRQEIVEVELQSICNVLKCKATDKFIVKNALNQEVSYQITYDNKMLIDASVRPCGTAEFTVALGKPAKMQCFVHGANHPERLDDIAWENDRTA
ncbi:MAG: DUF4861 family protein, partial [Prevotellaceae bacterium]|nr:DUF4861 family protein [Prevotellaceae bacterium]